MFTGRRIRVILNPTSGSGQGQSVSSGLRQAFAQTGPAELDLRQTTGPADFTRYALEAARDGFDVVLAAGGDGSVTGVAHGIRRSGLDVPIGIIPLGTGNGLARVLGLPVDPLAAVTALQRGRLVRLDVLDVPSHDATSLLFLGAGLDAEINRDADSANKSRLGFLAYVGAAFANVAGRRNHLIRLTTDGDTRELQAHTVSVFNATHLQLLGAPVGPDAHPHDGVAELSVMSSQGAVAVAAQVLRIAVRPSSRPELQRIGEAMIEADPPLLVHIDGDVRGETPLHVRVVPAALRFIAAASYRIPG